MDLNRSLTTGNRSLKLYAKKLERLGLYTFHDLLYHFPSRYEDYSIISKIDKVQEGEVVSLNGKVLSSKTVYTKSFKSMQRVVIADETGEMLLVWFNQPFLTKSFVVDDLVSVAGRIEKFSNKPAIFSPEYEKTEIDPINTRRIVPVYPATTGVSSKWIRKQIYLLLQEYLQSIPEPLPDQVLKRNGLLDLKRALMDIHFPSSYEVSATARARLSYDELFLLQLCALERKKQWRIEKKGIPMNEYKEKIEAFISSLPFSLTKSQYTSYKEILADMSRTTPMNRLLQGDVGSGKTIIAAIAAYETFLNGYQTVIMSPTEILAQQHYATIKKLLSPLGLSIGLLTSSHKLTEHDAYDIIIGTHSVVAKSTTFTRLGLVVIDEQQRFGVEQRGILRQKGDNPHLLTMTATPIPRTIALTLYGDLDVSYLLDMPKGRLPIKTWLVEPEKRMNSYEWIRKEIDTHNTQVFFVFPFIEESENLQTVKAATKEFEVLKNEIFPGSTLGLLHGKMKAKDKDSILQDFRNQKFQILVSTPVVEVGIDIPQATIIVIEGAERFGLAQLHQLRGRVGRNDMQSYCLLFTESKNPQAIDRLKAMETMSQGAQLAEFDLKIRGAGELYGLKQSGSGMLKIASFADSALIKHARDDAQEVSTQIEKYPELLKMVNDSNSKAVNPD